MKKSRGGQKTFGHEKRMRVIYGGILFAIGALLFAVGYTCFLLPSAVIPGGVSGIAGALHVRFGIPAWCVILLLNTPLVCAAYRLRGRKVALLSLVGAAGTGAASALPLVPFLLHSPYLSAAIGGALIGGGTGFLLRMRVTTGGTDLAAYLISKKVGLSVGIWSAILDTGVVVFAAVLLRNPFAVLHSATAVLFFAFFLDFTQKSLFKYLRILK